ncbi:MAG: 2,3,4,5-tetrahydropyridine-2,6-dicarboxylate N-succinyltransferase [Rickettsiales bacterium]
MIAIDLQKIIESAWEKRQSVSSDTGGELRDAVQQTLNLLDMGKIRVASPGDMGWTVNAWIKKAILLSFRLNSSRLMEGGPSCHGEKSVWYDKIPSKFNGWTESDFEKGGLRAVPGCFVRHGSYVAPNCVLMPSFVNIGAYVGEGTMVDSWATVGSCAQIGRRCHISGGVGIGGVLEPLQADPVIIEDDCFIGARSEVAEGVIVERGSVLSMGVYIGASTKIVERETGKVHYGRVPAYSVVVPGTLPGKAFSSDAPAPSLYAAVIVKTVDEKTRSKTSLNDLLRGW